MMTAAMVKENATNVMNESIEKIKEMSKTIFDKTTKAVNNVDLISAVTMTANKINRELDNIALSISYGFPKNTLQTQLLSVNADVKDMKEVFNKATDGCDQKSFDFVTKQIWTVDVRLKRLNSVVESLEA